MFMRVYDKEGGSNDEIQCHINNSITQKIEPLYKYKIRSMNVKYEV